jgi:hypothetical protein
VGHSIKKKKSRDPGHARKPEKNLISSLHAAYAASPSSRCATHLTRLKQQPSGEGEAAATQRGRGRSRVWNGSPSSVSWAAVSRRAPQEISCAPTDPFLFPCSSSCCTEPTHVQRRRQDTAGLRRSQISLLVYIVATPFAASSKCCYTASLFPYLDLHVA